MGEFAMHLAANEGDVERVKYLIEQGVSVDSRDDENSTPLHKAAYFGRYEVAQLLINNHCNLNLKDSSDMTPVMIAALWRRTDVMLLLLQSGSQVGGDEKGTLFHIASTFGLTNVVQHIVDSGETDVNSADLWGFTPLMNAVLSDQEDVAALLLRAGADAHRRSNDKMTALHCAHGIGVVQVLLEVEGLDLSPQDEEGDTPLHIACNLGHQDVVEKLLVAGADTCIRNNRNETVLTVAIRGEKPTLEVIRVLVQHGVFFEDCDYALISKNPFLKEQVLKDVDLCTQSIVNKFHHQSLPALKGNPNFANKLPCIKKFELNARQNRDVEDFVRSDIQAKTSCNIIKARPIVLSFLCVQALLSEFV